MRNSFGLKYSIDQYRTFGGARFVCFSSGEPIDAARRAYREAGLRVRTVRGDLYVHQDDAPFADLIAAQARLYGRPLNA